MSGAQRSYELAYAENTVGVTASTAGTAVDIPGLQISFTQGSGPVYVTVSGLVELLKGTATAGAICLGQLLLVDVSDGSIKQLNGFQNALASGNIFAYARAVLRLPASPGTARTYKGQIKPVTLPSGASVGVLAGATDPVQLYAEQK